MIYPSISSTAENLEKIAQQRLSDGYIEDSYRFSLLSDGTIRITVAVVNPLSNVHNTVIGARRELNNSFAVANSIVVANNVIEELTWH
jgi:hypothetical protein